jgi:hypothetical protein
LSVQSEDLDSLVNFTPLDDLWQLVVASQAPPAFLCGLCPLEDPRRVRTLGHQEIATKNILWKTGIT